MKEQVRAVLDEHDDLRWDDAVQIVLDETQLDRVRAEKQKAKKKSGDFTDADEDTGTTARASHEGIDWHLLAARAELVARGDPHHCGSTISESSGSTFRPSPGLPA